MAGFGQFVPEFLEILDDAVMDDGGAVGGVGVGVFLVRHPVGGPAGVADAGGAVNRLGGDFAGQVLQLAFGAAALDAAIHQRRDAGGIVAPVFEPFERFQ